MMNINDLAINVLSRCMVKIIQHCDEICMQCNQLTGKLFKINYLHQPHTLHITQTEK